MKPLYPDDYWQVEINWSRPSAYEKIREYGHELDDLAYLYLISAKYSSHSAKCIYIGKTYDQKVPVRLNQKDHKKRFAAFSGNYPRHKFHVSYGCVTVIDGKVTRKRISDIERILIYANSPSHAHNVQNFYEHGVKGSYVISNVGYKCTLPSQISLGIFIR